MPKKLYPCIHSIKAVDQLHASSQASAGWLEIGEPRLPRSPTSMHRRDHGSCIPLASSGRLVSGDTPLKWGHKAVAFALDDKFAVNARNNNFRRLVIASWNDSHGALFLRCHNVLSCPPLLWKLHTWPYYTTLHCASSTTSFFRSVGTCRASQCRSTYIYRK